MSQMENQRVYEIVTVNPNFDLPPDLINLRYENIEEDYDNVFAQRDSEVEAVVEYEDFYGDESSDEYGSEPDGTGTGIRPPDYISIVSQVARQTTDGRYVVDVIIDVEDLPNVLGYEVGITKA